MLALLRASGGLCRSLPARALLRVRLTWGSWTWLWRLLLPIAVRALWRRSLPACLLLWLRLPWRP
jgi:hypothetical protein